MILSFAWASRGRIPKPRATTGSRTSQRIEGVPSRSNLAENGTAGTEARWASELSFGLAGRRAIVTGHRGGIGGAIAARLAGDGVEVIGLDLPDFDLSDTADAGSPPGRT